jgi:hypothetical protein
LATTLTLQNAINFAQAFCQLRPLTGVGGVTNEPALTIANQVKQFILGAPFAWRWNRASVSFPTVAGTQDYTQAVTDLGWVEKASVKDSAGNEFEIPVKLILSKSSEQGQPQHIAAELDDNAGNITFRLLPVPDVVYTVTVTYQKKATLFTAPTSNWAPIPDELSYLYMKGFLAIALELADDPRAGIETQLYLRQVIAANAGLQESEKNIFLEGRLVNERQQQSELLGVQQGRTSRGA